ncbi:MAG TPA: hypothetical protein VHV32_00815 [Candidatus Angelobacter sp.]|nr:hypothetical protein [Candidatus Angelobacter sp.]
MQVQLIRRSRNIVPLSAFVILAAGVAILLTGMIVGPESQLLLNLGRWSIAFAMSLMFLTAILALPFRQLARGMGLRGPSIPVDFQYEPQLVLGQRITCKVSLVPRREMRVSKWSIVLLGVHDSEKQARVTQEVVHTMSQEKPLPRNQTHTFACDLLVPDDFPPSSENDTSVQWFLIIRLEPSIWTDFEGKVPVRVAGLVPNDQKVIV